MPVDAALPNVVNFGPAERARMVKDSIDLSEKMGTVGAGFIPKTDQTNCTANSKGLFAYYRAAEAGFVLTCRMPDGTGSGWAGITGIKDITMIDAKALTESRRTRRSRAARPKAIEPGRYTVILEPRANARFLSLMTGIFGGGCRRRSRRLPAAPRAPPVAAGGGGGGGGGGGRGGGGGGFLAGKKPGDKVFSDLFTLKSDIGNPILRQTPILGDNRPAKAVTWVEKGVLRGPEGTGPVANVNMSLVQEGSEPLDRRHGEADAPRPARHVLLVHPRRSGREPAAAQHRHDARRTVPDRERRNRRTGAELPLEHVAARRLQQPHARRQAGADSHGRVLRRRRHRRSFRRCASKSST